MELKVSLKFQIHLSQPRAFRNLSKTTTTDSEMALCLCILVDHFYLVMVDCFSLRRKGQEPESPRSPGAREGTEWVKAEAGIKEGFHLLLRLVATGL